jgi:hypothetical protein
MCLANLGDLGGPKSIQKLPKASTMSRGWCLLDPIGSHSCQFFPCQCLVIIIEFLEERQPGMDPELATGLILRLAAMASI